jgi:polyisoprenoid-binding protein YceI
MKIILLSAFSLLVSVAIASTNPTHGGEVDVTKSNITWLGKKVTGQHEGTVALKSGMLNLKDGNIMGGRFEIDMTTIKNTDMQGGGATKLEGHLASDDFFGVASHPVATVEIVSASKIEGTNTFNVNSNVTIKGITNPVTFVATLDDHAASAKIVVDRTKFDVKYGSGSFFDGLGDKMIYDDFELMVNLTLK